MIYTFYSYKGGVGRSMALANVAECFRERGLDVVMVDWDLEAPGLESFFYDPEPDASEGSVDAAPGGGLSGIGVAQSRLGLIDLLTEYKRSFSRILPPAQARPAIAVPKAFQKYQSDPEDEAGDEIDFATAVAAHLPPIASYLVPIHPKSEPDERPTMGSLSLLSAGWRYKDRFEGYAQAVRSFDWDGFYASYRGKEFVDWLRGELLKLGTVVLIDSRTGVTEMGGVCTRQLADVVVSFSAPNNQNIEGVARMAQTFRREKTLEARGRRKLETIIVPTRVDPSELEDLGRFKARFERIADERQYAPDDLKKLGKKFWDLQIPYRAKFAYQERRVIGPGHTPDPTTPGLDDAYWKLATHLALLAPESHEIRQRFAERLQREFSELLPKVVLSYLGDASTLAAGVSGMLRDAGLKLWPDLSHEGGQGSDFQNSTRVISQAAHLVVVLSEAAQADDGIIRRELRLARQLGKSTLVLALQNQHPEKAWLKSAETYWKISPEFLERLGAPARGMKAPVLAPAPGPGFVERKQLQERIKTYLIESGEGAGHAALAIWGPAGSGKSAVVARICQDDDVVDHYPGGIFTVTADDATAAARILALTKDVPLGQGADALKTAPLSFDRRALIVLEDVWNVKRAEDILKCFDGCDSMVLTRDLKVASTMAARVVKLDRLTDEEAEAFLPGGKEIADRLDRLPLALVLARSALQREEALGSAEAAIDSIASRLDRHDVVAFDRPGADRNDSLAKSIELTLNLLPIWQRRRFEQLAAIAATPDGAKLEPVEAVWAASPAGAGEPRPWTRRQSESFCQRLSELSLVNWDLSRQTITLHPIIRGYLTSQGMIGELRSLHTKRAVSTSKDREENEDVRMARKILGGLSVSFEDLTALWKRLKAARYFSDARQILGRLRALPEASEKRLYWAQQHAFCTYKDPDLPYEKRFERAVEILGEVENLKDTKDQETLGLAGAIFKYKWTVDGQQLNLERSLAYYMRGYNQGVEADAGYTGINAAFVLDLLAFQEESESKIGGLEAPAAKERREMARAIRKAIAEKLPGLPGQLGKEGLAKQYWFLATIGEALFGIERYDEARYWLREALAVSVDDWEFESTARQLVRIALLRDGGKMPAADSPAFLTLRTFLGNDANALRSVSVGKVGLALSGGGFRASLFQIGMLAKLAELDVLRHVEVLSCVSGGSIVGARYYLAVKRLLEQKADRDILREDYIDIVKQLESAFLDGIQGNLRTRLAANPLVHLKTLFTSRYSRTDRLAGLYEERLYGSREPIYMSDLLIRPKEAPDDFAPKLDNWHRAAKVPVLILNATTLNTGHTWQFTATWMGEPPSGVGTEVDGNDLLRRMYYWEAPKAYRKVRLGHAVAASACVPGLFDPVEFTGLYPMRTVRLVDGGVHDNQGVGSLLEQECSVLLVSDASGQMGTQNHPSGSPLGTLSRSSSILGARVREAEYLDLEARRRSSQLKSMMFIHLKKDLDADPVSWVDCIDPVDVTDEARPKDRRGPLTSYGILKTVQERLASVRTDLDSFHDVEAFALMLSGYRMAAHEFKRSVEDIPMASEPPADWAFLSIEKAMDRAKDFEDANDYLMSSLKVAGSRALKIWWLSPGVAVLGALLMLVLGTLSWEAWILLAPLLGKAGRGFWIAVGLLPPAVWCLFRIVGGKKSFAQLVTGFVLGSVGWPVALLHLWMFDPAYLAWGKVKSKNYAGAEGGFAWGRIAVVLIVLLLILLFNPLTGAYIAERSGDAEAAQRRWSQVLSLSSVPRAYLGRARANRTRGRYQDTIADFERAAVLAGDPVPVYGERAAYEFGNGDYKGAVADCDRIPPGAVALELRPTCEEARLKLAAPPVAVEDPVKLEAPLVANERVWILTGKANPGTELDDMSRELTASGYSVKAQKRLVDSGRPDVPEVRYFHPGDRYQANVFAVFLAAKLGKGSVSAKQYRDTSATPGYFEIWLGR